MKAFITDYDGVVINIEPQKAQAFGEMLNKYWKVDTEEAGKFWIATGGISRRYKFDYFYLQQFQKSLPDDEYRTIENDYSTLLKNKFYPKVRLLPEAKEMLSFARGNFDYVFVSSGVPMKEIQYLVKLNGVNDFFDKTYGTDKYFASKEDHFKEIVQKYSVNSIVFVADGPEDMRVGKKFDAFNIGVLSNHSQSELLNSGANEVCGAMDVISVIKRWLSFNK